MTIENGLDIGFDKKWFKSAFSVVGFSWVSEGLGLT